LGKIARAGMCPRTSLRRIYCSVGACPEPFGSGLVSDVKAKYLSPCFPFRVSFDPEDLRIEGNPFRMNPSPPPPAGFST